MKKKEQQAERPLESGGKDEKGEKEEPKKKRKRRSLELIAEFKNGYAVGWHFAVGECFKDQLDIKMTERKVPRIGEDGKPVMVPDTDDDGKPKLDKNGKPKMKVQKIPQLFWTQGRCYTFSQGDILYDTPKAYESVWEGALKQINRCCQVVQAVPDTPETYDSTGTAENPGTTGTPGTSEIDPLDEVGDIKPGSVTFTLTKPKKDGTGLEEHGEQHEMSQADFVDFLRTGHIR